MDYDEKIPEWENAGEEPTDLMTEGFQDKQTPHHSIFNWFWHNVLDWLSDLRTKLSSLHTQMESIKSTVTTLEGIKPDISAETILTNIKTVDGSGSGLDGDMVDGKHASAFALVGHGHSGFSLSTHSHGEVTASSNGMMPASYKAKLDGIATGANNYTHPSTHPASMITETDSLKMMTAAERTKLAGITAGATVYTHPSTHSASMITETSNALFMTVAERTKLAGIENGANNYVHPSTHPATMITGLDTQINSSGFKKVAMGSYLGDGTGEYGSDLSTKTQIIFPFAPSFVLMEIEDSRVALIGTNSGRMLLVQGESNSNNWTLSGNILYVAGSQAYGLNSEGDQYSWIAFGQ